MPSAKVLPDAGEQLAAPAPSTASVVAGLVNATTAPAALVASSTMFACAAITGAVVSWTFTVKLVDKETFPAASVA